LAHSWPMPDCGKLRNTQGPTERNVARLVDLVCLDSHKGGYRSPGVAVSSLRLRGSACCLSLHVAQLMNSIAVLGNVLVDAASRAQALPWRCSISGAHRPFLYTLSSDSDYSLEHVPDWSRPNHAHSIQRIFHAITKSSLTLNIDPVVQPDF
jgi:hypothetical protein